MAIRFQKRVSIFPGLRLNFSASGVSATIGVPGASVTVGGPSGPTANLGLPGTGLSARFPLADRTPSNVPMEGRNLFRDDFSQGAGLRTIGSAAPDQLSSGHLVGLRDILIDVRSQRLDATRDVERCQSPFEKSEKNLQAIQQRVSLLRDKQLRARESIFRKLNGWRIRRIDRKVARMKPKIEAAISDFKERRAELQDAENRVAGIWMDTEFNMSGPADAAWRLVAQLFCQMASSAAIWDITADRSKKRGEERSVATRVIDRSPVRISQSSLDFFSPDFKGLEWQNANGDKLYLYPSFLIVFRDERNFALIDLKELSCEFNAIRFEEREELPSDARQVDWAWELSNKDGSPDKRFRDNRQHPVMLYAEIRFRSASGLDESYMFSAAEAAARFADALTDFRNVALRGH